jgi:hypothetical protein
MEAGFITGGMEILWRRKKYFARFKLFGAPYGFFLFPQWSQILEIAKI